MQIVPSSSRPASMRGLEPIVEGPRAAIAAQAGADRFPGEIDRIVAATAPVAPAAESIVLTA